MVTEGEVVFSSLPSFSLEMTWFLFLFYYINSLLDLPPDCLNDCRLFIHQSNFNCLISQGIGTYFSCLIWYIDCSGLACVWLFVGDFRVQFPESGFKKRGEELLKTKEETHAPWCISSLFLQDCWFGVNRKVFVIGAKTPWKRQFFPYSQFNNGAQMHLHRRSLMLEKSHSN